MSDMNNAGETGGCCDGESKCFCSNCNCETTATKIVSEPKITQVVTTVCMGCSQVVGTKTVDVTDQPSEPEKTSEVNE